MSVEVWHQQQERIARLASALENYHLYAARHRKDEWAQHILLFGTDARVAGSPMRDARPEEVEWNKAQAAIALKVPRSGIPELDAMIRESRRLDAMEKIAAAMVSSIDSAENYDRLRNHAGSLGLKVSQWIALDSVKQADALLAASEKEERKC